MTSITQYGTLNTSSLTVPDLYIQIVTSGATSLSGAQTDIIGVVGTGSWGPINTPVVFGTSVERIAAFGPMQQSSYDLATTVSTAILQGASDFVGVRVTDGTDSPASVSVVAEKDSTTTQIILNSKYTGSYGNNITFQILSGSAPNTWKIIVAIPTQIPEVFDNISANGGNPAFWSTLVSAINSGQSSVRGPSQIVVASLGTDTTVAPAAIATTPLTGGTDGNTNVVSQTLVGNDGTTRTGMYSLRGQQCSIGILSGVTDDTTWTTQAAFGLDEGIYMLTSGPAGESVDTAITKRSSVGVDSYALKALLGDWIYWYDSENALTRLVSPSGFAAGKLAALSPQLPSLNKELYGIIGSQKSGLVSSGQTLTYSSAELEALFSNGIDVICNPAPGGSYWAVRAGINISSNSEINGDEYTRVTNFISETIAGGMGIYIGQPISPTLFSDVEATLTGFLSDLESQGVIGTTSGTVPYSVICSTQNNPQSRTSLGFLQADISVTYFGINKKFIVNITGGADVTVSSN
ncbi:phage tail protein [Acetobacter conturbans]|uniref:Phage tail protein n=1 Tax=Acetobacter conturbans TaxID=1737472 RepID=A0ABX0K3G4_9PROT|nr:phage tail protein [Acetobacter conturbans]NHN88863.1 phage tail protein [Acetobacter conturbans]